MVAESAGSVLELCGDFDERLAVDVGDFNLREVFSVVDLHQKTQVDGRMRLSTDCGCTFVKLVGKYGWET